jgi:hypothetical protein
VRESVRSLTRWLLVIPAIFLILLGCGQAGIVSAKIPLSADTRSRLRADYSPWPFFVVKPLNPAVYEVIQTDVGDEIALASPVAGKFWGTPSPTATVGGATITPSVTASPSSVPLGSATATEMASNVPPGTIVATATPSQTGVGEPTGPPNATATRTNTALPSATRTRTPTASATRTRTPLPPVTGPSGTHYRSIGVNSGTLYSAGNASVGQGSTTVTFGGGASLPGSEAVGAVGEGDRLVIGGETFFILSRDSATRVTVQTAAGATHTNEAYTIRRAYNTIQAWEDACAATPCLPTSGGGRGGNLVGEDRVEIGVAYKDGVFSPTSTTAFNGSTTNSTNYMGLTVAVGQRHTGVAGSGVIVDGASIIDIVGVSDHLFRLRDAAVRIEWLEIRNFPGDMVEGNAIHVDEGEAPGAYLSHLIIHDYTDNDSRGGINIYDDTIVRNSILYNGPTGIRTYGNDNPQVAIENVTVFGMTGDGIRAQAAGTYLIVNTISVGSLGQDFDIDDSGVALDPGSGFNLYATVEGDVHPGGNSQLPPGNLEDLFVSIGGSVNLHLEAAGNNAIDLGTSLLGMFSDDIDAESRPKGSAWNIGADE